MLENNDFTKMGVEMVGARFWKMGVGMVGRARAAGLDARTAQRKTRKKGKRQGKDTRKKDEFARGQ